MIARLQQLWSVSPLSSTMLVITIVLALRIAIRLGRILLSAKATAWPGEMLLVLATGGFAAIAIAGRLHWPLWLLLICTAIVAATQLRPASPADSRVALASVDLGLPFVMLYLLLNTIARGPWPLWASLTLAAGGGVLTVLQTFRAVCDQLPPSASPLFGVALAAIALNSPLGVLASLWIMATLALPLALQRPPIPLGATFVAWWFGVAAAAASQSWLLVVVFVGAALINGLLGNSAARRSPIRLAASILLSLAASLMLGPAVQRIGMPILRQLALGLNQFGRVETQPWIGITALNAASQRVLVLPSLIWLALLLVIGALLVVIAGYPPPTTEPLDPLRLDPVIRQRIWWLPKK